MTEHRGLLVMNWLHTLLSLGSVAPPKAVGAALDAGVAQGHVSLKGLQWVLEQFGGRGVGGSAMLRALLAERAGRYAPPEGALEQAFFDLIARAGLAPPQRQVEIRDATLIGWADAVWIEVRVLVELDGFETHGTREAFQSDREKDNRYTLAGWKVARFTWYDVTCRPEYVIQHLLALGVPLAA